VHTITMQMYNYITIISLIFVSLSHAQYLIGTGRGLLAVVGDTMKEVKWDPNSFGSASQLWDFELDPRFPNGSFFVGAGKKVWDIAGYNSNPGAPIILYTKKATVNDTRNQRWAWTSTHQIYPMMNPSVYVTVSTTGNISLQSVSPDPLYQTFTPVDPTVIKATIRNYAKDITATVSASTPFGLYNFGSNRFQVINVLKGFVISIKDNDGDDALHPDYAVTSKDECGITLVVGSPTYPYGMKSWTMRMMSNATKTVQNFQVNMTFVTNQIIGTASEVKVVYDATKKANVTVMGPAQKVSGNYQNDGSVRLYFDFVNHYQGNQFNGIFYFSSTSTTIEGTWEDMCPRNPENFGPFQLTMN